jgi:tetratricopeptide (TPR) repeat protein
MRSKLLRTILICIALLVIIESRNAVVVARQQDATAQSVEARKWLNEGVQAYKRGQNDEAIDDFQKAKDLDPSLVNAQLYLATAYSAQYIPGAPSPENTQYAQRAFQEFRAILDADPDNLSAIDGAGSILYNMAGSPFDPDKMEESKSYHQKHIALRPEDPEPYYWIGVIDWSLAYRGNREMRSAYNKTANKIIEDEEPMPPTLAPEFQQKYGEIVAEGIARLKKAVELRPDYVDAMAYLNLLYRQKADMELTAADREDDVRIADDLVDQAKAIKVKKLNSSPEPQQ